MPDALLLFVGLMALGSLTVQPIVFKTTDHIIPRRVEAEEGTLSVPEKRDKANSRRTLIRFVRFKGRVNNAPPIIYLAGGPGSSGTISASGDRFPFFMKLRDAGDVIALDQRGVAEAKHCVRKATYPLDQPLDVDSLTRQMRPFLQECAAQWKDRVELDGYNTLESAEDIEELRRALNVPKISLVGISYGTHLALAYIRQHPDRVHRAVLAGVEGPDQTYKSPASIEEVLVEIERLIAADPSARQRIPALRAAIRSIAARLEREPAAVTIDGKRVVVGADDFRAAVFSLLGEREDIRMIVARLEPIVRGDYRGIARWALRVRRGGDVLLMSLAMDCASGASAERMARIAAESRTATLGDVANLRLRARCASWPPTDLGDAFRSPLHSDIPVLFVSGTLDARTPPANAEEIRSGFPSSRHLLILNGAHDDDLLISSPAIARSFVSFLRGGWPDSDVISLPPLQFATR